MKNRGMTLFIAIAIMSILLFISFAVVNITVKGTIFATFGRDSQYAFYAADSGAECAIYWDSKFDPSTFAVPVGASITCAGQTVFTGSQNPIFGTTTASRIGGDLLVNRTSIFGLEFDLIGL